MNEAASKSKKKNIGEKFKSTARTFALLNVPLGMRERRTRKRQDDSAYRVQNYDRERMATGTKEDQTET